MSEGGGTQTSLAYLNFALVHWIWWLKGKTAQGIKYWSCIDEHFGQRAPEWKSESTYIMTRFKYTDQMLLQKRCSGPQEVLIDIYWHQTWVRPIFSFDSTQPQKVLIRLMTHNGFTRLDSNPLTIQCGFLKFASNRLTTQKASRILIQTTSRLKNFSESWFEATHDLMMLLIPSFLWPV